MEILSGSKTGKGDRTFHDILKDRVERYGEGRLDGSAG